MALLVKRVSWAGPGWIISGAGQALAMPALQAGLEKRVNVLTHVCKSDARVLVNAFRCFGWGVSPVEGHAWPSERPRMALSRSSPRL